MPPELGQVMPEEQPEAFDGGAVVEVGRANIQLC